MMGDAAWQADVATDDSLGDSGFSDGLPEMTKKGKKNRKSETKNRVARARREHAASLREPVRRRRQIEAEERADRVADSRRAITISRGQVARWRKQFVYLHGDGKADRAELIRAKGRFDVASDELGSDLAAYAIIPGVDLGADYYVAHHRYWQETRQEVQALCEQAPAHVSPMTTGSAPPGVLCGEDGYDAKPRPAVHFDLPLLRPSPGPQTFGPHQ